jgi:hypothetical protein
VKPEPISVLMPKNHPILNFSNLKHGEIVETGNAKMNDSTAEKEEKLQGHGSRLEKLEENSLIRAEKKRERCSTVDELQAPLRKVTEHTTLDHENKVHGELDKVEEVSTVNELVEGDGEFSGFNYENESTDLSEKIMTYMEKADQILDWLLTMRG